MKSLELNWREVLAAKVAIKTAIREVEEVIAEAKKSTHGMSHSLISLAKDELVTLLSILEKLGG